MNNFKKIGMTALAASLVSVSANAGAISVSGGASLGVTGLTGEGLNAGTSFSMGNQLTFSVSGELDNGLNVSVSFVLDQGDDKSTASSTSAVNGSAPFDSHSVTVSSDGLGSLKFSGEGGSSALSALDGTAAGDIWDDFDIASTVHPTGLGGGNNSMMYTLPAMIDGVAINASYTPRGTADSSTAYSVTYTGVEGLTASYGMGDGGNESTDGTAVKLSYAFGPITVGYSAYEHDTTGTASDDDTTSYQVSYTVSDELSVTYGAEETERGTLEDVESMGISAAYTAGGMTISAAMQEIDNMDGTTAASQDRERWALGLSFAF